MNLRFLPLSLAVLGACAESPDTGSHIGNPASIEFGVVRSELTESDADEAAVVMTDASGTVFSVRAAEIDVRDIKLDLPDGVVCAQVVDVLEGAECEPAEGPGEEAEIAIDGPFLVDLLAAEALPSLEAVVIPALDYTRVDYRVRSDAETSFRVEAEFIYNEQTLVLDLALDINEDARVENPDLVLEPNGTLSVGLNPELWLQNVDITGCLNAGTLIVAEGRVSVDEESACEVQDLVKTNVKSSSSLRARP